MASWTLRGLSERELATWLWLIFFMSLDLPRFKEKLEIWIVYEMSRFLKVGSNEKVTHTICRPNNSHLQDEWRQPGCGLLCTG